VVGHHHSQVIVLLPLARLYGLYAQREQTLNFRVAHHVGHLWRNDFNHIFGCAIRNSCRGATSFARSLAALILFHPLPVYPVNVAAILYPSHLSAFLPCKRRTLILYLSQIPL
jgi:hypothetical protein